MRWKCGRSGRTRTCDLRFWRPLLFQLSYAPARYVAYDSIMWASDWSTLSVLCHYSHLVRCGKFAAATLRT
jgi:hypothetical protein